MQPDVVETIYALAERIRSQILEAQKASFSAPLDIETVILQLGGAILASLDMPPDVHSEIRRIATGFEIQIRPGLSEPQKRLALAHALGHLILHMNFLDRTAWSQAEPYQDGAYRRTSGDYPLEELQAHHFSIAFLMPEHHFIARVNEHTKDNRCAVDAIASHFGVPMDAVALRGKWLRLFP